MASSNDAVDPIRVGPVRSPAGRGRRRDVSSARVLRVVLPIAAVSLIVGLFVPRWSGGSGETVQLAIDAATLAAGTRVENPRLTGVTADGSAYMFRADVARPDSATPKIIELDVVSGEVDMANGRTVWLRAASGLFTQDDRKFRLDGGVSLRTSDGYLVETSGVVADSDAHTVISDDRVVGHGPAGRVCAEKMTIRENDGGVAQFEGDVVVILTDLPGAKGAEAAETAAATPQTPTPKDGATELTVCQQTLWALDQAK